MAVSEMSKINLVGHQKDQDKIFSIIQDAGVMQIVENSNTVLLTDSLAEELAKVEYKLAGARFCMTFLSEYDTQKKSLLQKIKGKIELSQNELENLVNNFNFKFFKEVQELQKKINESHNIIDKAQADIKQLTPWQALQFIPSTTALPPTVGFKLFILPKNVFLSLQENVDKKLPASQLDIVQSNKKEVYASLIYLQAKNDKLTNILNSLDIKAEEIDDLIVLVPEHIKNLQNLIIEQEKLLVEDKKIAEDYAKKIKDLKIIFDYLTWQKDKIMAKQKAGLGWKLFSINGWVEKNNINKLNEQLSKATNNFYIEEISPEADENIPFAFKNSFWADPFEFVTSIYGSPKNGCPDPTPFLTPFFLIFFGLCLSDAGYGIILSVLAILGIKLMKPDKGMMKFFKVLFFGGLFTFFAGAFLGGWFGIVISDLNDGTIKNILLSLQAIDPVKDPIKMLIFSLILGVIQILTGIVINIWWKIKNNNLKSALLDDLVWLFFLSAMIIWGMHKTSVISWSGSVYLIYAGIIAIILTQGRQEKNPIMKLLKGIIGLYGLVGYLSDILSYSRLLALGLATGIIAMVVNLIASLTINMVPYLGYLIALTVIIGGHIFNITINALGSFIHASRLQFVEFFPKFMEGGGVNLAPIKKENKYIKIINNTSQE